MATTESRSPEAPLDASIAAFIANDDELRTEVRGFIVDMLDEMRYLMKWGSPQIKARMLSSLGSAMVRGTAARHEVDDEEAKARAAFEAAMEEARRPIEELAVETADLDDVEGD